MAFGIKQFATAVPQLGTSNLPFATTVKTSGGFLGLFGSTTTLPPFVPVQFNVVDNYGAAIAASQSIQIAAISAAILKIKGAPGVPGTLWAIDSDLSALSKSLSKIADNKQALADSLISLNVAVNAMVVAKNNETANLKVTAVNTIKSNNFYMAASADQPVMPPIEDQIKEALKDTAAFTTGATALGFVNNTINSMTFQISTYITGTETYKTVASKFEEFKQSVLSVVAPSATSIKESTEAITGVKGP
jgi:hypothetical protein